MAVSSSSINDIDLNVSFSLSITPDEKPDVPIDHLDKPAIDSNVLVVPPDVWHPNFTIDNRPITLHDSVLLHDSTAVAVARGFVLPRDQALLIDKSDIDAVNDSLAFSIQGAVSTSDLARRLHVRNEEMKFLRNQTGVLQRLLKYYKQKHMELKQENTQLKKLVLSYVEDLGPKILETEKDTKRLQQEYEKLQIDVQRFHTSLRPSSSKVLYLN
jgi:hypothetical protein